MSLTFKLPKLVSVGLLALIAAAFAPVRACEFCSAPSQTLAERYLTSEIVLVTEFQPDSVAKDEITWQYAIKSVVRDKEQQHQAGKFLSLQRTAPAGLQTLMMGGYLEKEKDKLVASWGEPIDVTVAALKYAREAPPVKAPKRLEYFARFLEDADQTISNDAYGEFAKAPYEEIVPIAKAMSPEKLRGWLKDPKTPQGRIGLFGMMLGLCGDQSDVESLHDRIVSLDEMQQPGINGMTAGYLMLAGEPGLELVEKRILTNPEATDTDLYARIQAIEFLLKYASGGLSRSRLQKSLYPLLTHPTHGEQVITTLARWKDWSIQDRLVAGFGKAPEAQKKAIIKFFLAATRDKTAEGQRTAARIEELKKLDGALVKKVVDFDPFMLKPPKTPAAAAPEQANN